MIHHVKRATRHLIFWSLLLTAIGLSAVRLMLMGIDSYKVNLETRIGVLVGTPVKLGSLGAKMRGVSPELVLKDINIESALATEKPAIHLKEIRLGINLREFLMNRDILSSSWITLVGAKLSVYRKQDGGFVVEGLKAGNGQPLWLFQGQQYKLLQSQITWQDRQKAGEPVFLDTVNMAIMNDGSHHRINVITKLPTNGDELKVVADLEGSVDKPTDIKGTVYIEGNHVNLHGLFSEYLPNGIAITTGTTNFKLWSHWQQTRLVSAQGNLQIQHAIFSRNDKAILSVNNLDTEFKGQVKEQQKETQQIEGGLIKDKPIKQRQWHVDINRFLLETDGDSKKSSKKWPDAIVSLAGEMSEDIGYQKLKMYAKQLDLAETTRLLQFFVPHDEHMQLFNEVHVKGQLKHFSLYVEPEIKSFAMAGWFDSLSAEPTLTIPGFENISGQVKGSDKVGKVEIAGKDGNFDYPKLFAKPLPFKQLNSLLEWQQTEEQWNLTSQSFDLNCSAFQGNSRFFVSVPKTEEKPFIDFQTSFKSDDLSQIANYLPTQIMKEKLKVWLSNAFVGGKLTNGNVLFYGKANDFPFNDGSGVFEAKAEIVDAEVKYNPEWPNISSINGELFFAQNSIWGIFKKGQTGKIDITKADVQISNLGVDEQLIINGEGHGDINQALGILQQSPLAARVTPFMAGSTVQGTTKATLNLIIPLRPGHEIKVDGNARLNNAELTVNRLGLKLNKITGDLKFNNQGVYANALQANALTHPILIDITQAAQETIVNVEGQVKVTDIENLLSLPSSAVAEGEAGYQLQLQIPKAPENNGAMQINVKSSLEGIALHLPGALSKTESENKPFELTVSLGEENILPIDLDYNNELKAALLVNAKERKINSGHVLIGMGKVKQTVSPGLTVEINREQLPLQDWLGLATSEQQTRPPGLSIREIKVHSNSALWQKTRIGLFDLTLIHNPDGWSGEIDSVVAKGKLQIPSNLQGINPINLDMDMLNLSVLKQFNSEANVSDIGFKPVLNVHSNKTLWQAENLGQLTLQTQRSPQGLLIKNLKLEGNDEKLTSTGEWKSNRLISTTTLKGQLKMSRADQLFDKLGITKDLTDTGGVIDFKFDWNGAPWQLSLLDLRGDMDVNLKSGRLLSVEPGFGRVLGILAVAQWIKRLQLDFSDIYEEGLTFNSINGHFDLLHGKATTKNLFIDAVPAKISITGDTDLAKQTVDHVIKVVPKSLDAVPIAGTIMAKVADMLGKSITGKDQEGFFFGSQYLVKGNWQAVQISSMHENDGLFQKTWNSITDFPWVEQKQ